MAAPWKTVIEEVAAKSRRRRTARVNGVEFIVVHHSVTPPSRGWEAILHIHLNIKPKPYSSIGYHFVIRGSDSQVYKCLPVDPAVVGAHAEHQNSVSIGVCVTGNYEEMPVNAAAVDALKGVLRELKRLYPKAKVVGHRDMRFSNTACPGKYLYSALQSLVRAERW